MKTHRYGCPHCGSEQVKEVQEVIALYPVTAWDEDGTPTDYGEPEADWGTGEVVKIEERFRCVECRAAFDHPARIEEPERADRFGEKTHRDGRPQCGGEGGGK